MSTTSTVKLNIGPKKGVGWCRMNDVEHHWKDGPTLTCNPPIHTRECINCGKKQYRKPEEWRDAP